MRIPGLTEPGYASGSLFGRGGGVTLPFWLGLALLLATLVVFWPATGFDFSHFDDGVYVRVNPSVTGGLTWDGFLEAFKVRHNYWLPTLWLSYMLDAQVFGPSPVGFHVTNVLLHALNSLLVFLLLRRMTGRPLLSVLSAGIWAVHPLRVETVAWVAERKGLLSTGLALLALWAWLIYLERRQARWLAASVACFALGLGAKPMIVTFPILLLVIDLWPLGRWGGRGGAAARLVLEKWPFFVLSAGSAVLTLVTQSPSYYKAGEVVRPATLAKAASSYVFYLRDLVWPAGLGPRFLSPIAEGFTLPLAAALAVVAASVAGAIAVHRRLPALAAGWLWYVAALFPVSGIVPVGIQWTGDRFTYLPHLLLMAGLVWTLDGALRSDLARRAFAAGILVVGVALSAVDRRQLTYWETPMTLADRAVALAPGDFTALRMHAKALVLQDLVGGTGALERFAGSFPGSKEAHFILGIALSLQGRYEEAVPHLNWASQLDPHATEVSLRLADLLFVMGRMDEAAAQYDRYLGTRPTEPKAPYAHHRYGVILHSAGYHPQAAEHLRRAVALRPGSALFRYDLAVVLEALGRGDEAASQYRQAIRLDPADGRARLNLGELLISMGDLAGSEAVFSDAARKWPEAAVGLYAAGRLAEMRGDAEGARRSYGRAMTAKPLPDELRRAVEEGLVGLHETAVRGPRGPVSASKGR